VIAIFGRISDLAIPLLIRKFHSAKLAVIVLPITAIGVVNPGEQLDPAQISLLALPTPIIGCVTFEADS